MSLEEQDPNFFIDKSPGKISVIAGRPGTGRSFLIKSAVPDHTFFYDPYFASGFKDLLGKLSKCRQGCLIAIESQLPNLIQSPDKFFRELFLYGKLKKQSYIIEWGLLSKDDAEPLQNVTYLKYIDTILLCLKKEKGFAIPQGVSGRFGSIGTDSLRTSLYYRIIVSKKDKCVKDQELKFTLKGE